MTQKTNARLGRVGLAFLFGVGLALLPSLIVQAAELNLISQTQKIGIGQQFQVDLMLDTENEEINAVEGKIIFPADLLELKEIRDGNSIVNLWIEKPSLNSKSYILYSGITPGGFNGDSGLLFSVIFEAKKEGIAHFEIRDARVLRNDSFGTPAEVKISSFQFNIKEVGLPGEIRLPEIKDAELPETFLPEIAQNESVFDGRWFVVFATQDKSSGIDHYEVIEKRREFKIQNLEFGDILRNMLFVFSPKSYLLNPKFWIVAESPYVLKDQELRSYIYVKAVDRAGNERIATVEPKYPLKWYENYENWIIIIIGLVVTLAILRLIVLKTKHQ